METLVLPFGGGLERDAGAFTTQPGRMADMRNVRPLGTRLKVRRGSQETTQLPDANGEPCTHVVSIQAIRSQTEALICGYYEESREVHVYRTSGRGKDPVHIGLWFTLENSADSPPVILSAESYGQAYLAHDERRSSLRAPTQVYSSSGGTMADLEANLDGQGDAPVKFRGVVTWLNYLVGWGWGTPGSERPEIVRVSKPGEPSSFLPDSYWIAGDRGAPVTACAQASGTLLVLKPTETYRIVGTHAENFGILPLFTLYGAVASRLAISIENTCYAWGLEGPWMASLDGSSDLEGPLNLERPQPGDLPPEGDVQTGFAVYVPSDRTLEWHFGERVYAYSLEAGAWSYRTRPRVAYSAGHLYSTRGLGTTPELTGEPHPISVEGNTLTWENHGADGDETVETYLLDNGDWIEVEPDVDVGTPTQTRSLGNLLSPGVTYTVAMRYRRNGQYGAKYQGLQPSWPAASRLVFTAHVGTPTGESKILSAVWTRTSSTREQVEIRAEGDATYDHQLNRDGAEIARIDVGAVVDQTGDRHFDFRDEEPEGETWEVYTVVPYINDVAGTESRPRHVYIGPPKPLSVRYAFKEPGPGDEPPPGQGIATISWRLPLGDNIRAQVRTDGGSWTEILSPNPEQTERNVSADPAIYVRSVQTAHGVEDYSEPVLATLSDDDDIDPPDPV